MIWDRGTWQPEDDPHKGLKKGHLDFTLDGEKLHGGWHLVRMHRRPGEKRDNWLLIKAARRRRARAPRDKDILEEKPLSVATGRDHGRNRQRRAEEGSQQAEEDSKAGDQSRRRARRRLRWPRSCAASQKRDERRNRRRAATDSSALPAFRRAVPCHARPTRRRTATTGSTKSNSTAIACRRGSTDGKVTLLTRRGLDWTAKFPADRRGDRQAAGRDGADRRRTGGRKASDGVSSFSLLQQDLKRRPRTTA